MGWNMLELIDAHSCGSPSKNRDSLARAELSRYSSACVTLFDPREIRASGTLQGELPVFHRTSCLREGLLLRYMNTNTTIQHLRSDKKR